ncbi:MAG: GNAT family N-acetyltransferase [Actinomycetota bacterium]|nr:GNAT family N-acetyltransferase [Actinomycetota bacterium]
MIDVRPLVDGEVPVVDDALPLNRLDQWRGEGSTFLIAWDEGRPVGHAHVAWEGTKLGVPEIQDVYVAKEARRRGVATELSLAAEREAAARGHDRLSLSVGTGNVAAQALYKRLGFEDSGLEPERVLGTIMLRGEPFEVDDTLVYLVKQLSGAGSA